MRILKVEPGQAPYEKEMEDTLAAIQQEVQGLFQPVYVEDGVILCCNEEGKLNGMAPNRWLEEDIICGPFFLVGDDHEGGFCSLTDDQIQKYTAQFQEPEQFTGQEPELKPRMDIFFMEDYEKYLQTQEGTPGRTNGAVLSGLHRAGGAEI